MEMESLQSKDLEMQPRSKRIKSMDQPSLTLSSLPEDIIFHILSLIDDTKEAARTSVLCKQWRYYWTHLNCLNFNFPCFNSWAVSFNVLTHVLQHRQPKKLSKLKIKFLGLGRFLNKDDEWRQKIVLLALDYAASHQTEEFETDFRSRYLELRNLETLTLKRGLNFRFLKTLKLRGEYFTHMVTDHIISSCEYLENLVLIGCSYHGKYHISHPRLVSLHLTDYHLCQHTSVIVVKAPRLKFFDLHLSTPMILNLDDCPCIEKVNIYLSVRTRFREEPVPELAWARPVNEYVSELFLVDYSKDLLMREDYPPFDARTPYDDLMLPCFLMLLTSMGKVCREVGSGTVVLHLFGKEMILNCRHGGAEPEYEVEVDRYVSADPFGQLINNVINDVFRTIRSGQVLNYRDANLILDKYGRTLRKVWGRWVNMRVDDMRVVDYEDF